jgi:RNA polymerase sigma-70 factor (ECF subfamily)
MSEKYATFNKEVTPLVLKKLLKQALYLTHSKKDDADDLFQSTLVRAWMHWHKYESDTKCGAWLYAIMRNLHINNCRKEAKSPEHFSNNYEITEDGSSMLFEEPIIAPPSLENPFSDEVMMAFSKLKIQHQTMVILYHFEGYSYEEISDFLGIPLGTVRSNLHRARRAFKPLIAEYAKENYGIAV